MATISSSGNINFDISMNFFKNYSTLKAKFRNKYDIDMYNIMGENVLLSMFSWDEKIFRPYLMDKILHDFGVCALIKTDTADYTPVIFNDVGGDRYADGYFKNAVCFDFTGKEYNFTDWRENENILVFFNNHLHCPDIFIDKYATMLAEVDKSINSNVSYSRLRPIPVAEDEAQKAKIDAIIKSILNGNLESVAIRKGAKSILDESGEIIETINLSHVEDSKYIQYLLHAYDSILSRMFYQMGISTIDNGKQAQITNDELNKNKSSALAITDSWYKSRLDGFKIAEDKTGEHFDFDYSEIWKSEIAKTETDENGNLINDEMENTSNQIEDTETENETGDENENQ